ncbi:uncharacterized protein DUF2188 [Saccharothrix carnea]|uniref:Uncharacterized protein DUF2188 n=1 Tax=Saccharothrix carnea TaxID=1280637 RepID=A0A2P8I705_SACCR|nr:DUF2188 domain-containing protein [Saccharothrix carnea]PSL54261.1 uncharacterized protein DUF2188 [Saccharothrix carnea]
MVNDKHENWSPQVGDAVVVAWGLDEVEGEIENIYQLGGATRVLVAVSLPDGGRETVVLPVDSVRPVAEQPQKDPGYWRSEATFLRILADKFANIGRDLLDIQLRPRLAEDREADIILSVRNGPPLIVEVKALRRGEEKTAMNAIHQLRRYMETAGSGSRGLLVFLGYGVEENVARTLEEYRDPRISIVVRRGPQDDRNVIEAAIGIIANAAEESFVDRDVVPGEQGGWDVLVPGVEGASFHAATQREAVQYAREVAAKGGGEVRVHTSGGKVRRIRSSN